MVFGPNTILHSMVLDLTQYTLCPMARHHSLGLVLEVKEKERRRSLPGSCNELRQIMLFTVDLSSVHERDQHLEVLLGDVLKSPGEQLLSHRALREIKI